MLGGMKEQEIRVETPDGLMRMFTVRPEGEGPFPVAVLFMDGIGYRDQIRQNARRFAAGGFYCIAPDLYHRGGDYAPFDFSKIAAEGMEGAEGKRLRAMAQSVTPETMVADTRAALAAIAADPAARHGAKVCVGYCMGARVALHIAAVMAGDFVAAAGIHPGALVTEQPDSPHHDLTSVKGELYFAFAEIDRSATAELVDRFRDEMARAGVRGEVERIPGVAHGFSMADLTVYDRDAGERHFEKTLELWRRNLSFEAVAI